VQCSRLIQLMIGIYDYRNRVYSPDLGRFIQTDPIRFDAGDGNIYRYVGNNPVNLIDPMGLQGSDYNKRTGGSANPGSEAVNSVCDISSDTWADLSVGLGIFGVAIAPYSTPLATALIGTAVTGAAVASYGSGRSGGRPNSRGR